MANVTIASNSAGMAGKWLPYYCKPFNLGYANAVGSSDDGTTYISKVTAGGTLQAIGGLCTSEYNTGFYYTITFTQGGGGGTSDNFVVKKYTLADTLVDTIYASETGGSDNGRYWAASSAMDCTIDIGVQIRFPSNSHTVFVDGDVYKITLPSRDTMDRQRLYHGGYSCFLRLPETEGKAYHSDIIPTNLKQRNLTLYIGSKLGTDASDQLVAVRSMEDYLGNSAISANLEWQVDPTSATSSVASGAGFEPGTGETWSLGTEFFNDSDPVSSADRPLIASAAASDVTWALPTTGGIEVLNLTVSGRAGHCRVRFQYKFGTGTPTVLAHNQFWQIYLMIS